MVKGLRLFFAFVFFGVSSSIDKTFAKKIVDPVPHEPASDFCAGGSKSLLLHYVIEIIEHLRCRRHLERL